MGCDAHVHVEIKIKGEWHHYSTFRPTRSYDLFALMAGVRNYDGLEPVAAPRGLPGDATFMTRFNRDQWGSDGHDDSWLSSEELVVLEDRWYRALEARGINRFDGGLAHDLEHGVFKQYLFGNSFAGWVRYPEDNRKLREAGMEDVRLVFWFDN